MDAARDTNFVYYLMSNASLSVYPNNKPQHFRTLLPTPLVLDGEWEVGLSTMIYVHNWNHLKSKSYLTVKLPVTIVSDNSRVMETIRVDFTAQQFDSLEHLLKVLNETVNTAIDAYLTQHQRTKKALQRQGTYTNNHMEFAFSASHSKKILLKDYGYGTDFTITLPAKTDPARELWRLLGFEDSADELKEKSESKHAASLSTHFPSLYVYSPIIEYVGVGDTHAPLLALVPVRGGLGDIVYERFDRPIYLRLRQKYIQELEISIKDDTGDDVQFGAAKTIVILHFRRRA